MNHYDCEPIQLRRLLPPIRFGRTAALPEKPMITDHETLTTRETLIPVNPAKLTDFDLACLRLIVRGDSFMGPLRLAIMDFVDAEDRRRDEDDFELIEPTYFRIDAVGMNADQLADFALHSIALLKLTTTEPGFSEMMSDSARLFANQLVGQSMWIVRHRLAQGFGGVK